MRIAMIGQKGIPAIYGGVERHVEELSVRLADFGNEVFVYCRPWYSQSQAKEKLYRGVNLIAIPSIKTKHLDAISHTLFSVISALKRGVDVIHFHGVGPSLISWLPRVVSPKTKVVVTFHCVDRKHKKWGPLARLALHLGEWAACRFTHETITVSKSLQAYCKTVYDGQTTYIPNGVKEIKPIGNDFINQEFGLESQSYILMVARLVAHKGAHNLIKTFKNIDTDLKLVIAGDSAFTDNYVKYLRELSSGDERIIFTGWQSGQILDELFANARFVVHPSESEGLPIAVLEAMSYGKAVLASDIPENLEVIHNYGFRYKNKNISDLENQLKTMINRDLNELENIGKQAREFVMKNYNWQSIAKDTNKVYKRVLTESKLVVQEI